MNIGEEIVAVYLEHIKGCEFTQANLYTPDVQGEIDVVGVNLEPKELYVCEAAIHLVTGLYYKKGGQPDNVKRIVDKFSRNIEYAEKYFPGYKKHFMFWSPVIRISSEKAKHNQMRDVEEIRARIEKEYGVEIEFVINEKFLLCLRELRDYARKQTKELKSSVLRFMQIEEYLKKHVKKLGLPVAGETG